MHFAAAPLTHSLELRKLGALHLNIVPYGLGWLGATRARPERLALLSVRARARRRPAGRACVARRAGDVEIERGRVERPTLRVQDDQQRDLRHAAVRSD